MVVVTLKWPRNRRAASACASAAAAAAAGLVAPAGAAPAMLVGTVVECCPADKELDLYTSATTAYVRQLQLQVACPLHYAVYV